MKWLAGLARQLDRVPLWIVLVVALWLGLAPFQPQPHLWQKLMMLTQGELALPLDIFDLLFHAAGPLWLVVRLLRQVRQVRQVSRARRRSP